MLSKPTAILCHHFQRAFSGGENLGVDRIAQSGDQAIDSRLDLFNDQALRRSFRVGDKPLLRIPFGARMLRASPISQVAKMRTRWLMAGFLVASCWFLANLKGLLETRNKKPATELLTPWAISVPQEQRHCGNDVYCLRVSGRGEAEAACAWWRTSAPRTQKMTSSEMFVAWSATRSRLRATKSASSAC